MSETVCAVVVTYNRKELLIECLEALRKQTRPVQGIYIIDNASTDDTPTLLLEKSYIKELPPTKIDEPWEGEFEIGTLTEEVQPIKIHYVRMNENTGGAGGFHEGVKRGYEREYDWLWLMDDDGVPKADCLFCLLSSKTYNFHYVASNLLDEAGVTHFQRAFKYARTDVVNFRGGPFNAVLLSNKLIQSIGFPMKNFFIWGDEYEYCNRISDAGFSLLTVKSAIHYHKRTMTDYRTCSRGYYFVRNKIYQYRLYIGVYRSKKIYLLGVFSEIAKFVLRLTLAFNFRQIVSSGYGFVRGWTDSLEDAKQQCHWWGVDSLTK